MNERTDERKNEQMNQMKKRTQLTHLKYIVSFWAQYHNALIEMMMFHRAGRI